MKMSELIARYGDDKIQFQNLDDCADTLNMGKKGITKITFGTEQPVTLRGTDKLGLVFAANKAATVSEGEEQGSARSGEEPPSSPSRERVEVLEEALTRALRLKGGWREAIVELEDFCSEPVRLKNMIAAADQLDEWAASTRAVLAGGKING